MQTLKKHSNIYPLVLSLRQQVSDHLVLNAGYNYANAKLSTNSDMMLDMSELSNENAISVDAQLPDYWNTYKANESTVQDIALKYHEYTNWVGEIPELKASINGSTYAIKDNGNVNASIKISKVRPYFGIGFGRSIPETRFGFQFDLGAIIAYCTLPDLQRMP